MVKKHSSEAFYALDDPLEAMKEAVLILFGAEGRWWHLSITFFQIAPAAGPVPPHAYWQASW
jgi:hypothetical protein